MCYRWLAIDILSRANSASPSCGLAFFLNSWRLSFFHFASLCRRDGSPMRNLGAESLTPSPSHQGTSFRLPASLLPHLPPSHTPQLAPSPTSHLTALSSSLYQSTRPGSVEREGARKSGRRPVAGKCCKVRTCTSSQLGSVCTCVYIHRLLINH